MVRWRETDCEFRISELELLSGIVKVATLLVLDTELLALGDGVLSHGCSGGAMLGEYMIKLCQVN